MIGGVGQVEDWGQLKRSAVEEGGGGCRAWNNHSRETQLSLSSSNKQKEKGRKRAAETKIPGQRDRRETSPSS